MGTSGGGGKLKGVPALTGLQLGEVILPQEAASHEHREHKEEAAGNREEPLLFPFQQAELPASLQGEGQGTPPRGSARGRREGSLPWPLLCLRFTQTSGEPTAWGKFHTCKTKGLPRIAPSTALPHMYLCTSVPLHSLFPLLGVPSLSYVLSETSKTR